jgi:hypothetical protein
VRETSNVQRAELFNSQRASRKWPISGPECVHTIILFKEKVASLIEKTIQKLHIEYSM